VSTTRLKPNLEAAPMLRKLRSHLLIFVSAVCCAVAQAEEAVEVDRYTFEVSTGLAATASFFLPLRVESCSKQFPDREAALRSSHERWKQDMRFAIEAGLKVIARETPDGVALMKAQVEAISRQMEDSSSKESTVKACDELLEQINQPHLFRGKRVHIEQ
jgi:hypothetical protein